MIRKVYVIALTLLASPVFSHSDGTVWERLGVADPVSILAWASVISVLFILISIVYQKGMKEHAKKLSFVFISVPVLIGTVYLSGATIYLNMVSATGGPVHWHADYEVWACGVGYELVDPEGLENRVGSPTVHEHNDNRIHVEGVLLDLEDASMHEYFESVAGEFTGKRLSIPATDGQKTWTNGNLCNGLPARWYMFVNGKMNIDMEEYIISPYADVPPGDRIKFVFSEKPANEINPNLGVEP